MRPERSKQCSLSAVMRACLRFYICKLCLILGIISDLFPGVVLPEPDYDVFLQALKDNLKKRNLQPVPWYIEKIIQVKSTTGCFAVRLFRGMLKL